MTCYYYLIVKIINMERLLSPCFIHIVKIYFSRYYCSYIANIANKCESKNHLLQQAATQPKRDAQVFQHCQEEIPTRCCLWNITRNFCKLDNLRVEGLKHPWMSFMRSHAGPSILTHQGHDEISTSLPYILGRRGQKIFPVYFEK